MSVDPADRRDGPAAAWWRATRPIFDAVLGHPFLTGLADASLPPAAFEYYVVQDAHYLRGYARALALVAAHAADETDVALFAQHAADAIEVERQLHYSLLAELGIDPAAAAAVEPGPATTAYVDHLVATCATGSFVEGLAAVLPCYWIYAEVGEHLLARSSPDPRYARWIATYGGPAFQATVAAVLEVVDRVAGDLEPAAARRAEALYTAGARYEWLFWDAAWTGREWPRFRSGPPSEGSAARVTGATAE